MRKKTFEELKNYILLIVFGLLIAFFITRIIAPVRVSGGSMNPLLENDDRLLTNKIACVLSKPKQSDLVVFKIGNSSKDYYIKRIVAIPGDIIEIKYNILLVNQLIVNENHYLS